MNQQDWTPVVIRGKATSSGFVTGVKDRTSAEVHALRKVEATEIAKPPKLKNSSRSEMAQARVALGLTQKQLDMRCSFAANSCNTWESGRICPTPQQIQILNRILKIKLEKD